MSWQVRSLFTAALLAVAAVSTPAFSQDWYAGLGLGRASGDGTCDLLNGPGVKCDETSRSFKLLGGYQINQNFGAEIGYTDLGKVKADSAAGNVEVKAKGLEFVGIGAYPFNPQWSVYGKLGLFRWDTDLKDGTGAIGSAKANGIDLTYGFGVRWDFAKTFAVRVEYQQYRDVGDLSTTGQSNIDVVGVTALFRF